MLEALLSKSCLLDTAHGQEGTCGVSVHDRAAMMGLGRHLSLRFSGFRCSFAEVEDDKSQKPTAMKHDYSDSYLKMHQHTLKAD